MKRQRWYVDPTFTRDHPDTDPHSPGPGKVWSQTVITIGPLQFRKALSFRFDDKTAPVWSARYGDFKLELTTGRYS